MEAKSAAPIVASVEIARPQGDVFAYVTDPSKFAEWWAGVEGGSSESGTAQRVGAKCTTTRRVGRTVRVVTIALDFEGHGIGKLLVPLVVRRQARNEMPANCRKLKQRLEAPSRSAA